MKGQSEQIIQWITKGDHDLGTAKVTYFHIPEYLDTITFHCQQAIEKYLKAYLMFQNTSMSPLRKVFFSHKVIGSVETPTSKQITLQNCNA
jgi:hypothetical protein